MTSASSTSYSWASLLTDGEARKPPSSSSLCPLSPPRGLLSASASGSAASSALFACGCSSSSARCSGWAGAEPLPSPSPMVPITSPTLTVSPSPLEMDSRTPSCSASTSKLILSVSSSTSASPERYGLALLLEPSSDRRVGDRLPKLRNMYLSQATYSLFLSTRSGRRRAPASPPRPFFVQVLLDALEGIPHDAGVLLLVELGRALGRARARGLADVADGQLALRERRSRGSTNVQAPMFCGSSWTHSDLPEVRVAVEHPLIWSSGNGYRSSTWRRPYRRPPRAYSLPASSV